MPEFGIVAGHIPHDHAPGDPGVLPLAVQLHRSAAEAGDDEPDLDSIREQHSAPAQEPEPAVAVTWAKFAWNRRTASWVYCGMTGEDEFAAEFEETNAQEGVHAITVALAAPSAERLRELATGSADLLPRTEVPSG